MQVSCLEDRWASSASFYQSIILAIFILQRSYDWRRWQIRRYWKWILIRIVVCFQLEIELIENARWLIASGNYYFAIILAVVVVWLWDRAIILWGGDSLLEMSLDWLYIQVIGAWDWVDGWREVRQVWESMCSEGYCRLYRLGFIRLIRWSSSIVITEYRDIWL